jgi:uncharacterized protein YjiS (DUF1127 family)
MAHYADHPLAHSPHLDVSLPQRAHFHLVRLAQLWRLWRQRSREQRYAAQFTDRDLWDVGLTRGDIYREFSQPFWQADGRRGGP